MDTMAVTPDVTMCYFICPKHSMTADDMLAATAIRIAALHTNSNICDVSII